MLGISSSLELPDSDVKFNTKKIMSLYKISRNIGPLLFSKYSLQHDLFLLLQLIGLMYTYPRYTRIKRITYRAQTIIPTERLIPSTNELHDIQGGTVVSETIEEMFRF